MNDLGLSHSLLMLVTPMLINLAYQFRLADERDFLIWLIKHQQKLW